MRPNPRAFDDKTKLINYLNTTYQKAITGKEYYRRRRLIQQAVDDIFSLHYFPKDPASVAWYHDKMREIIDDMEKKIEEVPVKEAPAPAAP